MIKNVETLYKALCSETGLIPNSVQKKPESQYTKTNLGLLYKLAYDKQVKGLHKTHSDIVDDNVSATKHQE